MFLTSTFILLTYQSPLPYYSPLNYLAVALISLSPCRRQPKKPIWVYEPVLSQELPPTVSAPPVLGRRQPTPTKAWEQTKGESQPRLAKGPTIEVEAEAETAPIRKRSKNNLIAAMDVKEQVIINAAFLNEFSQ